MLKVRGTTGSYELTASDEAIGRGHNDYDLCALMNSGRATQALMAEIISRPWIRYGGISIGFLPVNHGHFKETMR